MAKKPSDKSRRPTGEAARRIWLAGIGAYGRAFTEAQEAFKDMSGGTSRVFEELVKKGEDIEEAVSSKTQEFMEKNNPKTQIDDTMHTVDERIKKMRSRLVGGFEVAEDFNSIDDRLSSLEAKLDEVLKILEPQKPKPARAKKPTVKKQAAKKPTTKKTTK